MKHVVMPIIAGAVFSLVATGASATTLEDVKNDGVVKCGANASLLGFSSRDEDGNWSGFDVDFCRAIAAAVFNDPDAVEFVALSADDRFDALKSGEVDVLVRNTTWNMSRDTALGLAFGMVNYYDGQGFMVRKDSGLTSALELSGSTVCVRSGTTTRPNLIEYFERNRMKLEPIVFDSVEKANAAYDSARCVAYTTDASALYSTRLLLSAPDDHIVLPEVISKEPLGPVVRQGDEEWFNIVKWVGFALLNAEELGIKQSNVDAMKDSDDTNVRRLLGTEDALGEGIGLTNDWAANAVSAVGNYGEIFERNIGSGSPLQISRGLNALWTRGGIQYAPPMQ